MRSIGLPELLVISVVLILPVIALIWFLTNRGRQQPTTASRFCSHCGQRVPDIGTFCSFCGQKIT